MTIENILDRIKGVKYFLIDFDGTLIQNEELNKSSYQNLLDAFNITKPLSNEEWVQNCVGFTDREIADFFISTFNLDITADEVLKQNIKSRMQLYKTMDFPLNPLIKAIIEKYPNADYKILSNNNCDLIMYQLKKQGIDKYFSEIFSNQSTGLSKEEMLRQFIKNNNIDPKDICCIDDEPHKIIDFHNVGTQTIFIKNWANVDTINDIITYVTY